MPFKFEKLEVWQLSLEYLELIYKIAAQLPKSEDFNLKSQIVRAATSLNLRGDLKIRKSKLGVSEVYE